MKLISLVTVFLLPFLTARSVAASSVVLNELMPHPSSGSDWIEIYNPTSSNIDLSNWTLVDSTSVIKTPSGTIAANGFVTFDVTNRLNNSGDSIYLKDSSGDIIDNYSYTSDPGINKSIGRSPDGGNWTILTSSSKGSSNGGQPLPTPSPTPKLTPTPTPSPTPTPTHITTSASNPPSITTKPAVASKPPATYKPTSDKFDSPSFANARRIAASSYRIASVAAVAASSITLATSEAKVEVKDQEQINPIFWAGIIFIFAGALLIGYIYLKKNAKIHL